jgi:parallel beta-helix repeat protein
MVLVATRLRKYFLTLIAFVLLLQLAAVSARAQTRIDHCGTFIRSSGQYVVDRDLDCGPGGIIIQAGDVELSLAGHRISGTGGIGISILVSSGEVKVLGPGSVAGFAIGVFISNRLGPVEVVDVLSDGCSTGFSAAHSSTVHLRNNTAIGGASGFVLILVDHSMLTGNRANDNSSTGFDIRGNDNLVIGNKAFSNGEYGIALRYGSMRNEIISNEAMGNGSYDLYEDASGCTTNHWLANRFGSTNLYCIH